MKRLIILLFSINLFAIAMAQTFTLKGVISSTEGELLPGVTVRVKGTSVGTATDLDGAFAIKTKIGDVLEIAYIGFKSQSIKVRSEKHLNVVLSVDQNNLDDLVVVGYQQAKKLTLTGSVSGLNATEIKRVPTSSVQNTLQGKLPGFFSQQRSGQPGKDASDFFIRGVSSLNGDGNKPLIIVDDMEYTYEQLSQINVNEIEQISILKDASTTAVYGIKGANGVLVVKTRRGSEGKPQITARYETGVQMPVRTPKFLDSYNTAILVNEAYANDGIAPEFTRDDIIKFQDGSDPYGHPNVSWYDEIFKKSAMQQNVNVDVSGGSDRLKYFASVGYFTQGGLVRDFGSDQSDVNSNYFYRRFNFRTNLDFKVTDNFTMRFDMSSRFMNINEPRGLNATGEIYDFSKMHPYSAPVVNPNGTAAYLYDTNGYKATLNARLANEGYSRDRRNDNNMLLSANWDMSFLTKGLSADARVAYSTVDENYRQAWRSDYPTYHYDPVTDTYTINPNGIYTNGTFAITSGKVQDIKNLNLQASLRYNRSFLDETHNVNAMLLFNRQSSTNVGWAAVPANFEGYSLNVGYNYKQRYLIDFNGAYNGTDRFGKDNRFGFFPAVGVGYVISEEPFFKERLGDKVQLLKVRGSYGLVGSDVTYGNRYLYKQQYHSGGGYWFGEGGNGEGSIFEGDLGNDDVTWEKAKKLDIGLDFKIFNRLNVTVDYFRDIRYDQLASRSNIPAILGVGVSPTNVARTRNTGFDGSITYQDRFGEVDFNSSFVFSYAKNKVLYKAEAQQVYPWLAETGHSIGQQFGYHFLGYYTPEDIEAINRGDANAPAVPNTDVPVQAGDMKYQDLNEDGIINSYDRKAIGKPNLPNTTLGWSFGAFWKGFSINVLFQGSFNYSFSIVGTGIEPFKSQFQPIHTYRWTEERYENGEEILFPRLTSNPNTVNSPSSYMSDFWLIDAWYIRLKTVDLSYQLPKTVLPKFVDNIRIYASAYNLFTFTNYNKYQQDPEISTNSAGDAYMNQRVLNFGLQLTF